MFLTLRRASETNYLNIYVLTLFELIKIYERKIDKFCISYVIQMVTKSSQLFEKQKNTDIINIVVFN